VIYDRAGRYPEFIEHFHKQAMYVALQSDKDWIQDVQRKLHTRSKTCSKSCGDSSPISAT
jgi:hypothetical protein